MIKIISNIILIGTSHVSKDSVKEINEVVEKYEPEVVGIELDINRLKSLLADNPDEKKKKNKSLKMLKEIGISGYLFGIIAGFIQQKIGKQLGINPGADMKAAYNIAKDKKIITALIDINIKTTLKKMSKLKFTRKMSMFFSLFFKGFKKEYRNKINFDVKKGVPDEKVIQAAMDMMKKEVPDLYKILIEDRNKYMCDRLLDLKEKHEGYIVAVVGAGHLNGMVEYLNKKFLSTDISNSVNFSFNVDIE